jgi:hypothetical protein
MESKNGAAKPDRYTLDKATNEIIDEYILTHKDELIQNGLFDKTSVIRSLLLKALWPWLQDNPKLKDKYLSK